MKTPTIKDVTQFLIFRLNNLIADYADPLLVNHY